MIEKMLINYNISDEKVLLHHVFSATAALPALRQLVQEKKAPQPTLEADFDRFYSFFIISKKSTGIIAFTGENL